MKVTQIHEAFTAPADEGSGHKVTIHLLGSDLLFRKRSAVRWTVSSRVKTA